LFKQFLVTRAKHSRVYCSDRSLTSVGILFKMTNNAPLQRTICLSFFIYFCLVPKASTHEGEKKPEISLDFCPNLTDEDAVKQGVEWRRKANLLREVNILLLAVIHL
jgi:hypothetical protein